MIYDASVIFVLIFSVMSAHIGLKTKDNRNNIKNISVWISYYSKDSILHRTIRFVAHILNKITPRPNISTSILVLSVVIVYIITDLKIFGVPGGATNSPMKSLLIFTTLMVGFSYTFGSLSSKISNYCRYIKNNMHEEPDYNRKQLILLFIIWIVILWSGYSTFDSIYPALIVVISNILLLFVEFILHLNP